MYTVRIGWMHIRENWNVKVVRKIPYNRDGLASDRKASLLE